MDQPINNHEDQVQTGKSADPLKMWVIVLVILFLAATGVAVWQFLQVGSLSSRVSTLEASAAQLQADKNNLQAQLSGDDTTSTDSSGASSNPESAKILAAVDAYVRAPVSASKQSFEYSILKNENSFAKVNVGSPEGAGYALWLKKVGDNWTVLFGGQDNPGQDVIDQYGLPESFLK